MTTQQKYKHNPNAKMEKGDVSMNWNGNHFASSSVFFNTNTAGGIVFANYLSLKSAKNSKGGTDNDSFLACFLSNTDIPREFHQSYKDNSTDFPYRWAVYYEGAEHFATEGSIFGKFDTGYRKINAEIRMSLENGDKVVILFNAEKV
jgi:hypothetical protein